MKKKTLIAFLAAGLSLAAVPAARPQQTDQPQDRRHFTDEDRRSMRQWYALHRDELPPGLMKRDRLPADLEKKLVAHEVLPEDLRARIHPVSGEFLVRVPPAPEGCEYVFVGGHAVLLDAHTDDVYDVVHFEKKK